MRKQKLLVFILLFCCSAAFAQLDMMILKKGDKKIKTYMQGSYITFQLSNYQWVEGNITSIRNDSFFIRQAVMRQSVNFVGVPVLDTGYLNILGFHVNEVMAMPRKSEGFEFVKNGTLFMIGGGGYTALNVINTLGKKEPVFGKDNLGKVLAGVGTFAVGLVLNIIRPGDYTLGKKYKLSYIHVNANL